jgi:hypothetical protein
MFTPFAPFVGHVYPFCPACSCSPPFLPRLFFFGGLVLPRGYPVSGTADLIAAKDAHSVMRDDVEASAFDDDAPADGLCSTETGCLPRGTSLQCISAYKLDGLVLAGPPPPLQTAPPWRPPEPTSVRPWMPSCPALRWRALELAHATTTVHQGEIPGGLPEGTLLHDQPGHRSGGSRRSVPRLRAAKPVLHGLAGIQDT